MAQRINTAYGISNPLVNVFAQPIRARRAPTVNDKLDIGTLWIDQVGNQAYTLTSVTNNLANWSTLTIMGVGVFNAVEATNGDITADLGNIVATAGNISSGGTITSGNALTVVAGGLSVLAGDANVIAGNIVAATGNIVATAGDISTTAGNINSAGTVTAGSTITSAGTITATVGNIVASTGDITATLGNITAGATISAGTGFHTTAGGVTAVAGDITATNGDIVATGGDIIATVGNISAPSGTLTIGGILADSTIGGTLHVTGVLDVPDPAYVTLKTILMADLGSIHMQGETFLHAGNFPPGFNNYLGIQAGNTNLTQGAYNTGIGARSLFSLNNVTNAGNVALGFNSLTNLVTGVYNTALGIQTLQSMTTGTRNIAIGRSSLLNIVGSASYNIAIGYGAGANYTTTESSNIMIGNDGVLAENNTIRIGTDGAAPGQQNRCFIAGDVQTFRSITAQTGNITTSAGNFVASTPGKGVTLGGGASVVCGSGDPNGVVTAAKGSLYLNLTGSGVADRAWINTDGATTWTFITTGA